MRPASTAPAQQPASQALSMRSLPERGPPVRELARLSQCSGHEGKPRAISLRLSEAVARRACKGFEEPRDNPTNVTRPPTPFPCPPTYPPPTPLPLPPYPYPPTPHHPPTTTTNPPTTRLRQRTRPRNTQLGFQMGQLLSRPHGPARGLKTLHGISGGYVGEGGCHAYFPGRSIAAM